MGNNPIIPRCCSSDINVDKEKNGHDSEGVLKVGDEEFSNDGYSSCRGNPYHQEDSNSSGMNSGMVADEEDNSRLDYSVDGSFQVMAVKVEDKEEEVYARIHAEEELRMLEMKQEAELEEQERLEAALEKKALAKQELEDEKRQAAEQKAAQVAKQVEKHIPAPAKKKAKAAPKRSISPKKLSELQAAKKQTEAAKKQTAEEAARQAKEAEAKKKLEKWEKMSEEERKEKAKKMHAAAQEGKGAVMTTLLLEGCNPDAIGADDNTCLHVAARQGKREVVECLIYFKADPLLINRPKYTPLHYAMRAGSREIAELLVKADPDCKSLTKVNNIGKMPYEMAQDKSLSKWLKNYSTTPKTNVTPTKQANGAKK